MGNPDSLTASSSVCVQREVRDGGYPRTCQQCAAPYFAKKRHGKFCSDRCRAAFHTRAPEGNAQSKEIFRALVRACGLPAEVMLEIVNEDGSKRSSTAARLPITDETSSYIEAKP